MLRPDSLISRLAPWIIFLAAALAYLPFLGGVHLFDWDEINFAECAREMMVSHNYLDVQINFQPFWEKPPLFIWMQVLSMKVFGIGEFAARLPNAICGMLTLPLLYGLGKRLHSVSFGWWWVAAYAGSILPHLYFRSGIIDPWFNFFIFGSIAVLVFLQAESDSRRRWLSLLAGCLAGLALLTKGPVGLILIVGVAAVALIMQAMSAMAKASGKVHGPDFRISPIEVVLFTLAVIVVGGSWFFIQILNGHADMVIKFIKYQIRLFTIADAGHGGHWSYHFWVLLLGVFPASLLAIPALRWHNTLTGLAALFNRVMFILFWMVLLLFSVVHTKIIHYSSLCYFPLTWYAALAIERYMQGSLKWRKLTGIGLIGLALVFSLLTAAIPLVEHYKSRIIQSGTIKDQFAVANLGHTVVWTGWEWAAGVVLMGAMATGFYFAKKARFRRAFAFIFSGSFVFILLIIYLFPYRIEQYSQRTAVEFYQGCAQENCYVMNSGFFSYAPPFYAQRKPDDYRRPMWWLTGNIDRPFYLVLKEPHYQEYKHLVPAMKLLYKQDGWVFLARYPKPGSASELQHH